MGLATLLLAGSALHVTGAHAADLVVQPGMIHTTDPKAQGVSTTGVAFPCTLGFLFDGEGDLEGRAFFGTAAHCTFKLGQDIAVFGTTEVFGDVAYIGNSAAPETDFSLIEVRPEYRDRVSPAMLCHEQFPSGFTKHKKTEAGALVQLTDLASKASPSACGDSRKAVFTADDPQNYKVFGPIVFGDSGGPLVYEPTGEALGLQSRIGCFTLIEAPPCQSWGPTVQNILSRAQAAGFPIALRTVKAPKGS
jgi:hypothetical protein